jgi:hypothetical protein
MTAEARHRLDGSAVSRTARTVGLRSGGQRQPESGVSGERLFGGNGRPVTVTRLIRGSGSGRLIA